MPLLMLIAGASFACNNPVHRDGQSIRCNDGTAVMSLVGIEAPAIAAGCRHTANCDVDPGTAARDHLAELTRGQTVICTHENAARGGRRLHQQGVRCSANGVDLSCAMIRDGAAAQTVAGLGCPAIAVTTREQEALAVGARSFIALPKLWRWVPLYLMIVNLFTYLAFAEDKRRAKFGIKRISETHLLILVAFGGGVGAIIGQSRLNHMRDERPFTIYLAILIGLQIGLLAGFVGFGLL
jgi:uncharacterized membrane protein YsdA (DUF1294 family)